jgi:DNA-binding CsgD family transcriptional regulator
MANAEVAKILWISPGTVRKHLKNAYEKLGVHTRTAAVAAAIK